ncbi:hypothetical protein CDD83_3258 [Cordyceps sp. RAO-2017]|nr:hypothetical protein CDD83_3258 [Cordyceps sp. RAO-2017]
MALSHTRDHGIRFAFYSLNDRIATLNHSASSSSPHEALHAHTGVDHIRHCFDYLRQALMCAADTNLEPINLETRAVNGWGVERKCRDYEAIKDWAEKWAEGNATAIS